jgi:glycosyltransferase involved in cell wall biosynthesis
MISIIIPVYNIERYLSNCLDSILTQTFTDIEVIVINDGSTDRSGKIADEYEKKDHRIKVYHQHSKGVSSARNKGIELATGEYIGFVDGDDYVTEDMYGKLVQACLATGSEISVCRLGREIDGQLTNHDIGEFYTKELNNEEAMEELFKGVLYRFSLCNKLFKKECFTNIQFPVGRIHEDLSTTYQLFANANHVTYLNFIGYIYVKQENSILTTKYYQKRLEAFIGWNEILTFISTEYPQLLNRVYASYTYSCLDHIYGILHQVNNKKVKKEYLQHIQESIQIHHKNIIKNEIITFKYKYMITLLHYHTGLLLFNESIKKMIEKLR